MTEERKQELRQLLQEALANLEILPVNQLEGIIYNSRPIQTSLKASLVELFKRVTMDCKTLYI